MHAIIYGDAMRPHQIDVKVLRVYVNSDGLEVSPSAQDAIEIRCAGLGWPWHDVHGYEWGSSGGTLYGELAPRWVKKS